MSSTTSITISIQGNNYDLKCPDDQIEKLKSAAEIVHKKMGEAKSKTPSNEKAAILTALNVAHEFLEVQNNANINETELSNIANEQISNIINNIGQNLESYLTKNKK